jgi:DNA invertase Pin-like site-specific DNA recombinase
MSETNGHKKHTRRPRWIGVVRTSSDDQDGGADTQRDTIERWVRKRRDHLIAIFADEGVRGTVEYLPQREALAAAWAAVAAGEADGIVVTKLDRLARDLELQEMLLRECREREIIVASCNSEEERLLDGSEAPDPTRTLVRMILGAVAQYERGVIGIRCRAGIARAKREGRWMGGRRPYGQQLNEEGRLEIEPVEARIIGQGLTLRAQGCTLDEIGEFFMQAGMKPRLAKTKRHSLETVRGVLMTAADKGIEPAPLGALAQQFADVRRAVMAGGIDP